MEVLSDSTSDKDRTVKRELYDGQGVEHYLKVDPAKQSIQWLRLTHGVYGDLSIKIGLTEPFSIILEDGYELPFDPRAIFS